jgi:hypothetical protein
MKLKCLLQIEMESCIKGPAHATGGTGMAGFFQEETLGYISFIRIHQTCPE